MRRAPAALLALATAAIALGGAQAEPPSDPLRAPHRAGGRFFNPWAEDPTTLWGAIRWLLFSRNPHGPRGPTAVPRVENDGAYLAGVEHSATVTWVGHATFAVHDGPDVFLTDPQWSERALLPKRHSPPGIPLSAVPPDAFAVISHNHYDHLDRGTVEALPESVSWFVPLGLARWFRARGRERVVELDWWQSARHGRFEITCLPSQHRSRRLGLGDNTTLWCSWLVDSGDHRYYFAGDTGYFAGFAEYGRRFAPIDVAMLPIGAYEPRWFMRYQHLDPAEAYQAFLDLGARTMLPMHWGTFDLTDEPIDLPPKVLAAVVAERGGDPERVRTLAIGERWKVPERPPAPPQASGDASGPR